MNIDDQTAELGLEPKSQTTCLVVGTWARASAYEPKILYVVYERNAQKCAK